jgi:Inositol hexakisphosphate
VPMLEPLGAAEVNSAREASADDEAESAPHTPASASIEQRKRTAATTGGRRRSHRRRSKRRSNRSRRVLMVDSPSGAGPGGKSSNSKRSSSRRAAVSSNMTVPQLLKTTKRSRRFQLDKLWSIQPQNLMGPTNLFVAQRDGQILGRHMVLKSDHFPVVQLQASLAVHISGAPNFRKVPRQPIYGVGQPTAYGIRTIMNLMRVAGGKDHQLQAVWVNMREEPAIYINHRPFVLRELYHPFHNMYDFRGITEERLASIEHRLRSDILQEASENWGNILIHDEHSLNEVRAVWESATSKHVRTSQEVYEELVEEGYNVTYHRVPVTADSSPTPRTFDDLCTIFFASMSNPRRFFVFNCQLGRGRSTFGMICMYLLRARFHPRGRSFLARGRGSRNHKRGEVPTPHLHGTSSKQKASSIVHRSPALSRIGSPSAGGWTVSPPSLSLGLSQAASTTATTTHPRPSTIDSMVLPARASATAAVGDTSPASPSRRAVIHEHLPQHPSEVMSLVPVEQLDCDDGLDRFEQFRRGEYSIIRSLTRILRNGVQAKRDVDFVVDYCGEVHHLRESILAAYDRCETARDDEALTVFERHFRSRLLRYFYLICFQSYVLSTTMTDGKFEISFTDWLVQRPDIERLTKLDNLRPQQNLSTAPPDSELGRAATYIMLRSGDVLGSNTIIKSELVISKPSADKALVRMGMPNFRQLHEIPVAGLGQPSMGGIFRTLCFLGAVPPALNASQRNALEQVGLDMKEHSAGMLNSLPKSTVIWINLRQEPVLFINHEPFLLRSFEHPLRGLPEFTVGMTCERTSAIEQRWKQDVLQELSVNDGRLLLHFESGHRRVETRWVTVEGGASGIMTPSEYFDYLKSNGIDSEFYRVPLTVGETPSLKSFDRLYLVLNRHRLHTTTQSLVQTSTSSSSSESESDSDSDSDSISLSMDEDDEEEAGDMKPRDGHMPMTTRQRAPSPSPHHSHQLNSHNLIRSESSTNPDVRVVFNCQKGGRRSTVGMVVAVLMLMHQGFEFPSVRAIAKQSSVHMSTIHERQERQERDRSNDKLSLTVGPVTLVDEVHTPAPISLPSTLQHQFTERPSSSPAKPSPQLKGKATVTPIMLDSKSISRVAHSPMTEFDDVTDVQDEIRALETIARQTSGKHQASDFLLRPEDEEVGRAGVPASVSESSAQNRHRRGEFKGILGLIRIIKRGAFIKEQVDTAVDWCGSVHNLRHAITAAYMQAKNERNVSDGQHALHRAVKHLQSYAFLICFNSYLHHEYHWRMKRFRHGPTNSSTHQPFIQFSEWFQSRPELGKWIDMLREHPEEMLKVNTFTTDDEYAYIYESRGGNVLVNGSIVKCDFFKGCEHPALPQDMRGAVNFRELSVFPVAGCGAPTAEGMCNVLSHFGHKDMPFHGAAPLSPRIGRLSPGASHTKTAVWINLREEPVVYIDGVPFVLRDYDRPYQNIENTGITAKRVEGMERQLKRDIIAEARSHNGIMLLHDEDDDGNLMSYVYRADVNRLDEIIQTSAECYTASLGAFANDSSSPERRHRERAQSTSGEAPVVIAKYFRTPITDEQAPAMHTFDHFVQHLETAAAYWEGKSEPGTTDTDDIVTQNLVHSFFLFNCQMGRGRTTTAMIMACMWLVHRKKTIVDIEELRVAYQKRIAAAGGKRRDHSPSRMGQPGPSAADVSAIVSDEKHDVVPPPLELPPLVTEDLNNDDDSSMAPITPGPLVRQKSAEERAASQKRAWLAGEYRMIMALVRVLPDGLRIKDEADAIIDHCDHMQNLRSSIYDLQVRAENTIPSKRHSIVERGRAYMKRYFFLILFNAYFRDETPNRFKVSFVEWYSAQSEVANILSQYEEDFPPAPVS